MKLPSLDLKVIVEVPAATPVTRPVLLTVALVASDVVHVPDLSVASDGRTVPVNCRVAPTARDAVAGVTVTPVTATVSAQPSATSSTMARPNNFVLSVGQFAAMGNSSLMFRLTRRI